MFEDVALWHERDLAHSPVERVALPDSLLVGHYQATVAADLVRTLAVFPARMRANLEQTSGQIYSSVVLAELLESGMEREDAYRAVQAAASRVSTSTVDFRTALSEDGIDIGPLTPDRFFAHHHIIRTRLESLRELED